MCGKDIDFCDDFIQRYRSAFDEHIVQLPGNVRTLAMAESTAAKIISYQTLTVPGLMQTPEYADGLYRAAGIADEEQIPALVQARTDRQATVRRHDRADCLFYIHEIALQQRVGDDQTMEDQYLRLLFNARIVRIVPDDVVAASDGFSLWEYEKAKPVAYSETEFAQMFVQDPGAVARTRLHLNRLAEVALDEEQTRNKLMEYIGRPREELDLLRTHPA